MWGFCFYASRNASATVSTTSAHAPGSGWRTSCEPGLRFRRAAERATPFTSIRRRHGEIRRARGNRIERGAERERQTQQRTLQIGARTWRALRDHRDAPRFGRGRDDRQQLRLHFEHDPYALPRDERHEAHELQRIAETLFGVHE